MAEGMMGRGRVREVIEVEYDTEWRQQVFGCGF